MSRLQAIRIFQEPIACAVLAFGILIVAYIALEPAITRSQVYTGFTVTQGVTAEISFLTNATDITMSPTIPGITGGTANGATQVVVNTNNAAGYNMTITSSSSPAMQGNATAGVIPDFSTTTVDMFEPSYNFTVAANDAGFGYTVEASSTGDVDPSFMDNGSICNAGTNESTDQCWMGASTSAFTIINRASSTLASGATTTIKFRTVIQSSPSPAIPQDTYVATTTLTAQVNP